MDVATDKPVKAPLPWGAAVERGRPVRWLAVGDQMREARCRVRDPASDGSYRNIKTATGSMVTTGCVLLDGDLWSHLP